MTRKFFPCSAWWAGVAILIAGLGSLSATELKRRVLVLPFDNLQKNKDVAWMSDSIADNLKTDLLKSDRFEVLDVALLRKIDPAMQFQNLNATNASAFARRLNCEVAVVGRFTAQKDGRQLLVSFEAEGVDALEERSVVTLRQEARVDAGVFDKVERLASEISDELKQKLKPLDADSFKRDNKLEILIRRLENPPKGFLDDLQIAGFTLKPAFDIDTFDYSVDFNYEDVERFKEIELKYMYWGRQFEPGFSESHDLRCSAEKCQLTGANPVLAFTKTLRDREIVYRVRINLPDPRGPVIARWWLATGYPYMQSFSTLGMKNPEAIEPGSKLQLDAMKGFAFFEAGLTPGRGQFLPGQLRWSLVLQSGYGQGDMAQYLADNPTKAKIHLLSLGGGMRIDRLLKVGRTWSLAPFLGFTAQYQRYFRQIDSGFLQTVGFAPEIGLNNYFRLSSKSPWHLMVTAAAGSYLYAEQNLTYFRAAVGIEYVIK
ncbi:MAG: hypothetical protein ACOY5B_10745 [Spirochaetota bacterium]